MRASFYLGVALLFVPALVLDAQATPRAATNAQQRADASVLKQSSMILGIPVARLRVDRSYAEQASPGDALDIVEIVIAVEEDLEIAIDDDAIYRAADAKGTSDLARQLSIAEFQGVVREALSAAGG